MTNLQNLHGPSSSRIGPLAVNSLIVTKAAGQGLAAPGSVLGQSSALHKAAMSLPII